MLPISWIHVIFTIIIMFILAQLLKFFASDDEFKGIFTKLSKKKQKKNILFVIAHPDDECMFFGPTIVHFVEKDQYNVYMVCLSSGNYYGQGSVRQKELWKSCGKLGIPSENIMLFKYDTLPDNPKCFWPNSEIAKIIEHHAASFSIDMIISFDDRGVSCHLNHASIYRALKYLKHKKRLEDNCRVLLLDTVHRVRHYISFLDAPISFTFSTHKVIASYAQYKKIRAAMKCHSSQYVWFRILHVYSSRYMWINTLSEL